MSKKRLLIIDGNALVHRAWHALPPLQAKNGMLVNAVYGFTTIFLKAIKEIKPEYVAVTFDSKAPTFRHKEYKEYKATRKKQPDELYAQIPLLENLMKAFNVPVFKLDGFEADDLIGTICKKKSVDNSDIESVIVTGDLDTLQLVDNNTKVYTLKRGISDIVIYDEAMVRERYHLNPDQLIDFKALRGDPSDNIPGVKGIGEKSAQELIQEFGSLEKIYEYLEGKGSHEKIREKIQSLLVAQKKEAMLSKHLVTILGDAPIDFDLKLCRFGNIDKEKIFSLFQEFGFKSLLNRLPETIIDTKEQGNLFAFQPKATAEAKRPWLKDKKYTLITEQKDLDKLTNILKKQKAFAIDTETTGLDAMEAKLLGISLSWKPDEAYYISTVSGKIKDLKELKKIIADPQIKKVGHNIKYDLEILQHAGMDMQGLFFDTMLASYLLDPGTRAHNLDSLAFSEFGHQMIPIEELIGAKRQQITLDQVPVGKVSDYSCEDADYTWQLYKTLEPQLEKKDLRKLFDEVEMPLIPVLATMETKGIKIDPDLLKKLAKKTGTKIAGLEEKIYQIAGQKFNVHSPLQLKEILFTKLEIPLEGIAKTKTGFSTAAAELDKLKGLHPIINLIIEHRELAKLQSTYLEALPKLINITTSRIHTSFNQTITATGRLSSSEPNLQNIPARTEMGQEIRKAFIAEKGYKILSADYSQIELRIIASLANDKEMIQAFLDGVDIHSKTAAEIWGVKLADVTYDMRRAAKTINFGVTYGMGVFGLAASAEIPREKAREFIDKYFELYYGVRDYLEETKNLAHEQGYVETLLGRKRYLPDINSGVPQIRNAAERTAINMPMQGTAADIIKLAMIAIEAELKKDHPKTKMILQVHDELVFEVPDKEVKTVAIMVKKAMENVVKLKVPIKVEISVGDNWGELENLKI